MRKKGWKKWVLYVPQLLVLLMVFNLNLSGMAFSQHQKLSLNLKDATLEEFIAAIKQQCDVGFIYDYNKVKDLSGITISAKNEEITKVLHQALKGTGIAAEIENNTIILRKEEARTTLPQKNTPLKGKVEDEKGNPIPGVTVVIKGSAIGCSTDENGRFETLIPDPVGKTLVFTFIGMEPVEVPIKDPLQAIRVVMKEAVENLKEVVVTGIFQRKKESFTGSATTYTAKDLKMVGNQNVIQSLKSLDPALLVLDSKEYGSDPNRLPEMEIRGKTSIVGLKEQYGTDPNQPLFILDGFETTLQTIMNLSLDRVASITILKDAASTAIYGSKAANGVIVVETRQPAAGKLRVSYSGDFSVSFADLTDYNLMNSEEKLQFESLSGYYKADKLDDQLVKDNRYYRNLAEIRRGVDSYWLSEPLRVAFNHRHNLYVEGGDQAMRYGLGVNYGKTKGVMKGSDKDIADVNIDLLYRVNNLRFSNKASFEYSDADREPVAFSTFAQANPYYRKTDEAGDVSRYLDIFTDSDGNEIKIPNPLFAYRLVHKNNTRSMTLRDNFQVEWDIFKELRVRGRIGLTMNNADQEVYKSPKHPDFLDVTELERGSYNEGKTKAFAYDGDVSIIFGKLFAEKHQVNLVGGWNFNESKTTNSGYTTIGFINDLYINPSFSAGFKNGSKPVYSKETSRATSFFLNGNYSYDDRYLMDVNFRSDGSSVFGVENKFTTTWSFGLAWNMHNEQFMKGIGWLNMLKFRASIGNPGNQNFNAYQAMKTYTYNSWLQNKFGTSALIDAFGNRDLEWQKTIDKNIGVDVVLWGNRVRFNFDYYYKDTDPLLVYIQVPPSVGTSQVTTNLGRQINKGFNGTLSVSPIYRIEDGINWSINFNFKHDVGEFRGIGSSLDNLNEANRESKNLVRYYDGASPDDLWAVRSLGIDPATGHELFLKKDGTSSFRHDTDDEVVVGNSRPDLEGIIGTNFYYKGWTLATSFRYRLGGQTFASALYDKVENISESELFYNQDKRALYNRWQKPGDKAKFKGISLTEETPMSSRFVVDENTFAGESISLGYETNAPWLKKYIGASSFSFTAYMNDIFYISSIKEERGIEYPFARSVSFSLRLTF